MPELLLSGSTTHHVETLIRSLSRFSEQTMLILTGKSDVGLQAKKIGPALIFERLWEQTGIGQAIRLWKDFPSRGGSAATDNPGTMSRTQNPTGSAKNPCQSCSGL